MELNFIEVLSNFIKCYLKRARYGPPGNGT